MMKKTYTIEETLIVTKEVEIEVTEDMDKFDIKEAVQDKAYEITIHNYAHEHGWEGQDCLEVRIYDAKGQDIGV